MSDVSCVCSAPIVREARERGLYSPALAEGLGLRLEELEDPRARIPWRDFVVFAERAGRMLGAETLEELAADATFDYVPRPLRRLLPKLRDSRTLFTFAARWWGPWVFHGTRATCEVLPDGRLREIVRILPEHEPCPEFLAGINGTLRGMPRLLGQPEAFVHFEQDGREAEYLIAPPPRRTTASRMSRFEAAKRRQSLRSRARSELAQARRDHEELRTARKQLVESDRSTRRMSTLLEEQSRRLGTLQRLGALLVRGSDPETLRQQITQLLGDEPGIGGVRLSVHGELGSPSGIAASGRLVGEPVEIVALTVAQRQIGELAFWTDGEGGEASLLQLAPWIAFALEYGGSRSRVGELQHLLGDDVRDWERMEQRLAKLVARQAGKSTSAPVAPPAARSQRSAESAETFDLARLLDQMVPGLYLLTGADLPIELRCAEGLWATSADAMRLASFIESVVDVMCTTDSEEIVIETSAVDEEGSAVVESSTAKVQIWGRGGTIDGAARGRMHAAFRRFAAAAVLDVRSGPERGVGVQVFVPLLTPGADRPLH